MSERQVAFLSKDQNGHFFVTVSQDLIDDLGRDENDTILIEKTQIIEFVKKELS